MAAFQELLFGGCLINYMYVNRFGQWQNGRNTS